MTMLDRGQPLSLWGSWWNAIQSLRPAFSRLRAFMWFATIVAGMTVRTELLGVTSIVWALNLRPNLLRGPAQRMEYFPRIHHRLEPPAKLGRALNRHQQ
jgi:hypothetical protein